MLLLQPTQVLLIGLDGCFELLDVLGAAFAKCSLSLSVTLLPLFRRGIYLKSVSGDVSDNSTSHAESRTHGLATTFALLGLSGFLGWFGASLCLGSRFDGAGRCLARRAFDLGGGSHIVVVVEAVIAHLLQVPDSGNRQSQ